MDNAKSDMEGAYNETQRSLDLCLNGLGSKLKARGEDGFGRMRACQQNEDV
jgi:hypothetical protein